MPPDNSANAASAHQENHQGVVGKPLAGGSGDGDGGTSGCGEGSDSAQWSQRRPEKADDSERDACRCADPAGPDEGCAEIGKG
jgi:hypothetical protein